MSHILLQVGVKVFLKNSEGKYLFVKRSAEKYPGTDGVWDIVGGRIEPRTSLLENLAREVKEETSLFMTSVPVLVAAQDIIPDSERHIVRITYRAETEGEPKLDTSENIEYAWMTLEEAKAHEGLDVYVRDILEKRLLAG